MAKLKYNRYIIKKREVNKLGLSKKILYGIGLCFLSLFLFRAQPVLADIDNVSVTPLIESGSVTDKYQLIVKPGETREVGISLTNFGGNKTTLIISPNNASTTPDGEFTYDDHVTDGTNGLQAVFSDMTSEQEVTLKPDETKNIHFKIAIPQKKFTGLIMGGFNIYTKGQEANPNRQTANIPVWITEDNKIVQPEFKLLGITSRPVLSQPHIIVNVANTKPVALQNISTNFTVTYQGLFGWGLIGTKKFYAAKSGLKVAPNSTLPIDINLKNTPVPAGKYLVEGTVSAGSKRWKFIGNYHISKNVAKSTNDDSKGLVTDWTWLFVLGIATLIIIIAIVIFIIVRQNRKYERKH